MKLIRIGASWCSSCLIMKSRVADILNSYPDLDVINYDYDFDEYESYQISYDDVRELLNSLKKRKKDLWVMDYSKKNIQILLPN